MITEVARTLPKGGDRACRVLLQTSLANLLDLKPMVGGSRIGEGFHNSSQNSHYAVLLGKPISGGVYDLPN